MNECAQAGQRLCTINALTNLRLYEFGYDAEGRLSNAGHNSEHSDLRPSEAMSVWQGVKDALRVDDVTSAAAFMHSDTRADYQAIWNLLPPETLANIDQIMTSVQLTEVSPFSAQY